jgi:choline dehydrogenase-like flavoprotein
VEDLREPHELSRRFVDAVDEAGLGRNDDFNGERQEGGGLFQATQRSGRRWSCASGFLRPAMRRSNVTVVTGATTHRVVFEGKRAVGIDYYRPPDGGVTVRARREVILSAGAFGSPHLLMLSGIGHAEHLRDNGIEVVEDLPVGDHLQDHPCLSMIWRSRVGPTLEDAETNTNLAKWAMLRRGPLTSTVAEACAFAHSKEGLPAADLQYHFAPGFFQHHGFVKPEHASFTVGTVLVSPQSRGRIRLRSADPSAHPSILGNHLQESADVDAIVRSMELTREIVSCGPLRKIAGDALEPPTEHATKDEQRDWIRNEIELLYHPVGTCRMGQPGDSVVDPQLRVHGLEGLRVVDASVFPLIPGGNTNAPTIMVAEKAADLIRGN